MLSLQTRIALAQRSTNGHPFGGFSRSGGDPGIGKSTLLLQISNETAKKGTVLYVSGEESAEQIKLRATRLHVENDNLLILSETELDTILIHAAKTDPKIIIIDSIQTMFDPNCTSIPGSINQVKESRVENNSKKKISTAFLLV